MNKLLVFLSLVCFYTSYTKLNGQIPKSIESGISSFNTKPEINENFINIKNTSSSKVLINSVLDSPISHYKNGSYLKDINLNVLDSLVLIVRGDIEMKSFLFKNTSYSSLQQKLDALLNYEIQNGYLKASYHFDTIIVIKEKVIINYNLNLGRRYSIDSIKIHRSSSSLNLNFIQNYLRKYYSKRNEMDWKEIAEQIRYIDFIEMEKSPDFTIMDTVAILNLYLKERKLNQVNAIMGILSNAYNSNDVEITGDVKLSFVNLFKQGISFDLNWQKNLTNSQFLFTKFNLPFLFNTKIGTSGLFSIEKFDTTYLRVQYQMGLNYNIQYNQVISFFYRKNNSTIVGFNKQDVINGRLPEHLDFTTDEFGIGYKVVKLNRPFFTRKGWSLDANFLLGNKLTKVNSKISELNDGNGISLVRLYKEIPLSQLTLSFFVDANRFTPLGRDLVLKTSLDSRAWISETVSTGEKYYIGGSKLLRGFDDNNFIVPYYICLSNELQYYLSEYFYSNIFVDVASFKNSINNELNYPIGLGGGLSLKSKDNIFRVNIGTGYLGTSSSSLGSLKVHINYISVF